MHRLLGHCSPDVARRMLTNGMATGLRLEFRDGKPFFRQTERATEFGGQVHSDVWGPAPVKSLKLYLLAEKSETFEAYKSFEAWCKTQHKAPRRGRHGAPADGPRHARAQWRCGAPQSGPCQHPADQRAWRQVASPRAGRARSSARGASSREGSLGWRRTPRTACACEAAAQLEGEQTGWDVVEQPAAAAAPEQPEPAAVAPHPAAPVPAPSAPDRPTRVRLPSRRVQELLAGVGTTSARPSDPVVARGVQPPSIPLELGQEENLEADGEGDWMMGAEDDEVALAAEMSDADALEPRSLAEARRRPDWPLWEQAIREERWGPTSSAPSGFSARRRTPPATSSATRLASSRRASLKSQGLTTSTRSRPSRSLHPFALCWPSPRATTSSGDEVIFMRQPPGFTAHDASGKVCRLRKTLYGLKQSGRRWYQRLVEILCDKLGIVVVHVDDCTIAATTLALGELHWLLGIQVRRDREAKTLGLSQSAYIDSILRRYNLLRPRSTLPCATSPTPRLSGRSCTRCWARAPTFRLR